jgi:hypothetical protein
LQAIELQAHWPVMAPDDFFKKIEAHRDELASAGVRRLGVYGSVARAKPDRIATLIFLSSSTELPISLSSLPCGIAWSKCSDDP